jgi:hypothetical protein
MARAISSRQRRSKELVKTKVYKIPNEKVKCFEKYFWEIFDERPALWMAGGKRSPAEVI